MTTRRGFLLGSASVAAAAALPAVPLARAPLVYTTYSTGPAFLADTIPDVIAPAQKLVTAHLRAILQEICDNDWRLDSDNVFRRDTRADAG